MLQRLKIVNSSPQVFGSRIRLAHRLISTGFMRWEKMWSCSRIKISNLISHDQDRLIGMELDSVKEATAVIPDITYGISYWRLANSMIIECIMFQHQGLSAAKHILFYTRRVAEIHVKGMKRGLPFQCICTNKVKKIPARVGYGFAVSVSFSIGSMFCPSFLVLGTQ